MPPRSSKERHQENIVALRRLVDAGSPRVVRDTVAAGRFTATRRKYPLPSIGHRSGKLTVTGYLMSAKGRGGLQAIIVACACNGVEYTINRHNFKDFKSTRCRDCGNKAGAVKHYWAYAQVMPADEHRRRLLNRINAAITRCHTPSNKAYEHYGGRGIHVHDAWRADRAEFLRYVITLPGWDDKTLEMDRIDVDRGYEPGNIRFVSRGQNMRNKRRIADLQQRILELEAEVASLRSSKCRPQT